MYGVKENLIPATKTTVELFLARDFTNRELPDAAFEAGQSLNAYRAENPGPFMAAAAGPADEIRSENEAHALAAEIQAELPQGFGADGDDFGKLGDGQLLLKIGKLLKFLAPIILPLILGDEQK